MEHTIYNIYMDRKGSGQTERGDFKKDPKVSGLQKW